MKNALAILIITVLFTSCSGNKIKESDKYIPIEGIVFGMSLNEMLELYPEPADIKIGRNNKGLHPSELYNGISGQLTERYSEAVLEDLIVYISEVTLEDITVYGMDATVILLFTSDRMKLNGEDYYCSLGLTSTKITFHDITVQEDIDWIYANLSEGYNVERTRLTSKTTIENIDADLRSSFEEHMSNLTFFNETQEQNYIVDRWQAFEKGIENYNDGFDAPSTQRFVYFATGSFAFNGDMLYLQGIMAAYLYNMPDE